MSFLTQYLLPFLACFAVLYFFAWLLMVLLDRIKSRIAAYFGVKAQLYFGCLGIWIHEASHAVFALIFHHRILQINLMEFRVQGDQATLGHVDHAYNPHSIYQMIGNFFIGLGPLMGCSGFLALCLRLLQPEFYHSLTGDLKALTTQPRFFSWSNAFQQLPQAIQWDGKIFIFMLLLLLTVIGFGLSWSDLKNSFYGLPFMLILGLIVNLTGWLLHWPLDAFWTQLAVNTFVFFGLITIVTLMYGLFIWLLSEIVSFWF